MKVLVTGGAGYIGSKLVPMLLGDGYDVTVVDSLKFGGQGLVPCIGINRFNFVNTDVRNEKIMRELIKGVDVVIHLAAIVGFPACRQNPAEARSTNIDATELLTSLMDSGNQLLIYGSTGSNYGALKEGVCTESTPLDPLTEYGITKTKAEQISMKYGNTIAYRFATAFGVSPRMRIDLLINDLTYLAVNQGYVVVYESHFMRTFIHVHDIARSFIHGIKNHNAMRNNVYNVGSNRMNYSKKQVCELICQKTGALAHYADVGEDADKRNYQVDYGKIESTGFETTINLENGINELINAYKLIRIKSPLRNV